MLVAPLVTASAPLLAEVTRLGSDRAFVLGSTETTLASQLRSVLPANAVVTSIETTSPTELCALVALQAKWASARAPERVLVASDLHPEMLSGLAAISRSKGWPVLFIDPGDPQSASRMTAGLEASSAVLTDDGSSAVPSAERGLRSRLGPFGIRQMRLTERYGAAEALHKWAEGIGMRFRDVAVASGARTPAALTAAQLAARRGSLARVQRLADRCTVRSSGGRAVADVRRNSD